MLITSFIKTPKITSSRAGVNKGRQDSDNAQTYQGQFAGLYFWKYYTSVDKSLLNAVVSYVYPISVNKKQCYRMLDMRIYCFKFTPRCLLIP